MTRLFAVFVMLAPLHAFVLPSARATPRTSITCVAQQQQPTSSSSGEHAVSRRSMVGHAVGGLCGKQGRYFKPARPKRLIGRGRPELRAAWSTIRS